MAADLTRAALLYRSGPHRDFPLPDPEATLGFSGANVVRIPMEGVSRRHAKISFDGKDHWIEDAGSSNGTFVNGVRLTKRERLKHLDVVTLGRSTDLIFVLRTREPARVTRHGIKSASIEALDGGEAGSRWTIPRGSITIGRAASNNVVVDSQLISKMHTRLECTGVQLVVTDLHSHNGTYVDGEKLVEPRILKEGDEFVLAGARHFRVHIEEGSIETSGVGPLPLQAQSEAALPMDWKTRMEWTPEELASFERGRKGDTGLREAAPPPAAKPGAAAKPDGKAAAAAAKAAEVKPHAAAPKPEAKRAAAPAKPEPKPAAVPKSAEAAPAPPAANPVEAAPAAPKIEVKPPAAPAKPVEPAPAAPAKPAEAAPAAPKIEVKPPAAAAAKPAEAAPIVPKIEVKPPAAPAKPAEAAPIVPPKPEVKPPAAAVPPVEAVREEPAPPPPAAAGRIASGFVHGAAVRLSGEATRALVEDEATKTRLYLEGKDQTLPLPTGNHEVGRLSGISIRLDEHEISRRHAIVHVSNAEVVVEDLGSHNGTFVNGERITAPRKLNPGDLLAFGNVAFRVRFPTEAGTARKPE